jgi:hypothetical protein
MTSIFVLAAARFFRCEPPCVVFFLSCVPFSRDSLDVALFPRYSQSGMLSGMLFTTFVTMYVK